MRIGSSNLGGISGGLYQAFEVVGRFFFLLLLGADRSGVIGLEPLRPLLANKRIVVLGEASHGDDSLSWPRAASSTC